jgi:hypothetical protein
MLDEFCRTPRPTLTDNERFRANWISPDTNVEIDSCFHFWHKLSIKYVILIVIVIVIVTQDKTTSRLV